MTAKQLAAVLDNGADTARLAAAQTLATSDPATLGPATLALVRGVSDEAIREWCAAALEEMGPPPAELATALAALLTAPADTAYWAATLLGRLGGDATQVVPALAEAAGGNGALAVRERAVWALGKVGLAASSAKPVLEQLARSDHARLANLAEQALVSVSG